MNKSFYRTMLKIAVPITLQNLITSSMNIVDVFMIGQLGATSIASVGIANQIFFLLILLLFGISSGASIFTAQYWGKKDIKNIKKVLGLTLILSIFGAILFAMLSFFIPRQLIGIYSKDREVVDLGAKYLKIVGVSYIITSISFSYSLILRSVGETKLPLYTSIISIIINIILNYILIFGNFGFPKLGVEGAAIATTIARYVEGITLVSIIYIKRYILAAKFNELLNISKEFIKKFIKISLPVTLNEFLWALGITSYNIIYARIGTEAIAAVNIENSIEGIAFVMFIGLGSATSVMLGNKLGEGDGEIEAYNYAKKFIKLGMIFSILMGIFVFLISKPVLSLYNVSESVKRDSEFLLRIFSFYITIKVFNLLNVVGILRSGGDTKVGLFIDIGGMWGIGVPLAFFTGIILKLPIYYVYFFANFEEITKMILGYIRFRKKKWIRNLANE